MLYEPEVTESAMMEVFVKNWALRSSHVKTKKYPDGMTKVKVDYMGIGKKREPEIRKRVSRTVASATNETLKRVWNKEVGLLSRPKECKGIAVSPDCMSVFCADFSEWTDTDVSPAFARRKGLEETKYLFEDLVRFRLFLSRCCHYDVTKPLYFMACEEYKTKTSPTTIGECVDVAEKLGDKFRILSIMHPLAKKVVGQYMDQLFHQA
eukprot:Nk52_evm1s883 gene=Nk52_evmTU1s883